MFNEATDIIAIDFEFWMANMGNPEIRCMSALSLVSGQRWDFWADKLPVQPPWDFNSDIVFIVHFAEAECACFLELGWGLPAYIFDTHTVISQLRAVPAKKLHNKKQYPKQFSYGTSLLHLCQSFGVKHSYEDAKDEMRELAIQDKRSSEYTEDEKQSLIAYCRSDVDVYIELLPKILEYLQ